MSIRAVVFDRDGVLTYFDLAPVTQLIASIPGLGLEEMNGLWASWCETESAPQTAAEVRLFMFGFWKKLCTSLSLDDGMGSRLQGFDYMRVIRPFDDARPALSALKMRGLRIGVLSNAAMPNVGASLAATGLGDLVDAAVSAPAIGCSKPAARAYLHALELLGVAAHEAMFVDDDMANVAGARAIGMRACFVDRRAKSAANDPSTIRSLGAIADLIEEH